MNQTSKTFVEKARAEAAAAPVVEGEERANALLAEARSRIYHWPDDFSGFRCELRLLQDADVWKGSLHAPDSKRFQFEWGREIERELRNWLNYHLSELLAHRESPKRSKMASASGVVFGDHDAMFGDQIIFPQDPMESFYRVRDGRLTQIGRAYAKTKFVINIEQHHEFDGDFAAHSYTAYYWSKTDESLQKVETYRDQYTKVEELWLPASRRFTESSGAGFLNREIQFVEHALL